MIDQFSAYLFGRHVPGGAHDRAGGRRALDSRGLSVARFRVRRCAIRGETEIKDLDVPGGRHEHVLGLQIAMHDAARVRRLEASRDLRGVVDGLPTRIGLVPIASRREWPSSNSITAYVMPRSVPKS